MSEQLVFTSCSRSIDSDTEGMQVLKYSSGISAEAKARMPRYASYSLNGTELDPIIDDEADLPKYPPAFRYVSTDAGRYLCSTRYLGVDWSRTRFGGNYVASAVEVTGMEGYPIEYFGSGLFHDVLEPGENNPGSRPGYMPALDLRLEPGRAVTFESVRRFVAENGLDSVIELIGSVLAGGDTVFSDAPGNVPFWIGAVTMAFPLPIAEGISFSTFGQILSFEGHAVVARYASSPGLRFVPEGSGIEDPLLLEYIRRVYTEPGFRDRFLGFIDSINGTPRDIPALKELYLIYLYGTNDPGYRGHDPEGLIPKTVAARPDAYGEDALYRYLDECMRSPGDVRELEAYSRCAASVTDPGRAAELRGRYLRIMYETLRGLSSAADMKPDTGFYAGIMRDYIGTSNTPSMDTPAEIFLVLKLWTEGHGSDYGDLLSRSSLNGRGDALVGMINSDSMGIDTCISEGCPLPKEIKAVIRDSSLSGLDGMKVADIVRLYGGYIGRNDDTAWALFSRVCNRSDCGYIVERYLKSLALPGSHTLSEALDLCLRSPDCSFGVILREFHLRGLKPGDPDVDRTVAELNRRVYPPDPGQKLMDDCQTLSVIYGDYSRTVDGRNNIAAALALKDLRDGNTVLPEGWNYRPQKEEALDYIGKITDSALSPNRGPGWYEAVLGLFPDMRADVLASMNGYMADELSHRRSMAAVCGYSAAVIRTSPSEEDVRAFIKTVSKNRHVKREEFCAGLRSTGFLDDKEMEAVERIYEPPKRLFGGRGSSKPASEQQEDPADPSESGEGGDEMLPKPSRDADKDSGAPGKVVSISVSNGRAVSERPAQEPSAPAVRGGDVQEPAPAAQPAKAKKHWLFGKR